MSSQIAVLFVACGRQAHHSYALCGCVPPIDVPPFAQKRAVPKHRFLSTHAAGAKGPPPEITVTVKQAGKPDAALTAPSGANLRDFLTENGINVYQSVTRWTNCKGKQLCG